MTTADFYFPNTILIEQDTTLVGEAITYKTDYAVDVPILFSDFQNLAIKYGNSHSSSVSAGDDIEFDTSSVSGNSTALSKYFYKDSNNSNNVQPMKVNDTSRYNGSYASPNPQLSSDTKITGAVSSNINQYYNTIGFRILELVAYILFGNADLQSPITNDDAFLNDNVSHNDLFNSEQRPIANITSQILWGIFTQLQNHDVLRTLYEQIFAFYPERFINQNVISSDLAGNYPYLLPFKAGDTIHVHLTFNSSICVETAVFQFKSINTYIKELTDKTINVKKATIKAYDNSSETLLSSTVNNKISRTIDLRIKLQNTVNITTTGSNPWNKP